MENAPSIKSIASSYGLMLGISLSLILILIYSFNIDLMTKWWIRLIEFIILLVIVIMGISKCKKSFNGIFTFKKSFTSYFIIIVLGLTIYTLVNYILFNFIDPEAANYVLEKVIEMTRSMMESFGAPQSEIDKAITKMQEENQFSIGNQAMGLVFSIAFYSLIGLLIALIFREKDPAAAA